LLLEHLGKSFAAPVDIYRRVSPLSRCFPSLLPGASLNISQNISI
jgi:hypothetical protein